MSQHDTLTQALQKIADWDSHTTEYDVDYGSNGVRDFYRNIAATALSATQPAQAAQSVDVRSLLDSVAAKADRIDRLGEIVERQQKAMRAVMSRLAEMLDEDQFAHIENLVARAGYTPPQQPAPVVPEPKWIVNDLGELGVKVGDRFFFLYKGENIEYGVDGIGEARNGVAFHSDGTPMQYRIVGKREFGETCWPLKWITAGRSEDRYTENLLFTPGLSNGRPEDGEWRDLQAATPTPPAQAAADARDALLTESARWEKSDHRLAVWEALRVLGSRMGVMVTREDQYAALATHQQRQDGGEG